MRTAFFETLVATAETDERIHLFVGDLGFGVVEEFAARFPDRFFNVGVAEQNMTGMAAGLALTGAVVVTYSIGNFPTLRCLEQIRNDVCYHEANVKVVTVGGGLSYGALGPSHHATEDLAIMRALPSLSIVAPGDPAETRSAVSHALAMPGPVYLRLGRAGETAVHLGPVDASPGAILELQRGDDVTLLSTGASLPTADVVGRRLADLGIGTTVASVPWLDPFDVDTIRRLARSTRLVVTLEEHSVIGGLGGAVAEVLAEATDVAPLLRIGLPHQFTSVVGSQDYLRRHYGLDADSVVASIVRRLEPQE